MNTSVITSLGFVRISTVSPRVTPADVDGNVEEIIRHAELAQQDAVEIALFPELSLTGYTCGDLFRQPTLLNAALNGLDRIRRWSAGVPMMVVVGLPYVSSGRLFNIAAVVQNGHVIACVPKTFLPNTQEFYDLRWFSSGRDAIEDEIRIGDANVPFGTDLLIADADDPSLTIGIEICEDLWAIEPPSGKMARDGATLILNLSASNDLVGKSHYRRDLVRMQSARTYTAYVYSSAGPSESTTDMVFSGHGMIAECGEVLGESERLVLEGASVTADIDLARCVRDRLSGTSWSQEQSENVFRVVEMTLARTLKSDVRRKIDPLPFVPADRGDRAERCKEILALQATGLAVRLQRSRSTSMVLGLSGGLDSTLALIVCLLACEKLGWDRDAIVAISMPGLGTTERTRANAQELALTLGTSFFTIPIADAVNAHFADILHDPSQTNVVFENAQARERTQILMDMANKVEGIVVGTGDLSEIALGWSTYNADHMSMYNPNAGVPKTLVQHLIAWYAEETNSSEVAAVLRDILSTPISPELLPADANGTIAQRTEDVIGPYEVHDFFLYQFVRLQAPVTHIAVLSCLVFSDKFSQSQIIGWLDVFLTRFFANQFKRSCMPDGVKIGSVALSPRADWRMPSDASAELWRGELRSIAQSIGVEVRR
ncbi:MAG: NAD(+) synthase [Candidatus Kapabacteria bacterium]|nr:NAD(+) synthase [Candidatus Kapabacteria bacterium]